MRGSGAHVRPSLRRTASMTAAEPYFSANDSSVFTSRLSGFVFSSAWRLRFSQCPMRSA